MAKTLLFLLMVSFISVFNLGSSVSAEKTWCVAKPSSDNTTLTANLEYACSEVDCKVIQMGGGCSFPNYTINHASIAMNLYYQAKGRNYWNCDFGKSALIVTTDPSYGDCIYA